MNKKHIPVQFIGGKDLSVCVLDVPVNGLVNFVTVILGK